MKRDENTTDELETAALAMICADALEAAGNPGQAAEEFRQIGFAVKAALNEEPADSGEVSSDSKEGPGGPGETRVDPGEDTADLSEASAYSSVSLANSREDPIELKLDFIRMTDLRYAVRLIGLCVDVSPLLLQGAKTLPAAALAEYGTAAELLAAAARSAAYRVYRGTRTMDNRAEARHYNSKALDGSKKAGKMLSAVCDTVYRKLTIL